jgi:hypothetical protein
LQTKVQVRILALKPNKVNKVSIIKTSARWDEPAEVSH